MPKKPIYPIYENKKEGEGRKEEGDRVCKNPARRNSFL